MFDYSVRITTRHECDGMAVERTIEVGAYEPPKPVQIANTIDFDTDDSERTAPAAAAAPAATHTKILADGTRVDGSDPRTDHVAMIDYDTGLMWSVESLGDVVGDSIDQPACEARCKALRLLGFDDWRLPTRAELAGLVNDTRHEPAIDTSLFPRVKPRWHWTSTPAAWSSASAWGVLFSGGLISNSPRGYGGFALAVRRAGQ